MIGKCCNCDKEIDFGDIAIDTNKEICFDCFKKIFKINSIDFNNVCTCCGDETIFHKHFLFYDVYNIKKFEVCNNCLKKHYDEFILAIL